MEERRAASQICAEPESATLAALATLDLQPRRPLSEGILFLVAIERGLDFL